MFEPIPRNSSLLTALLSVCTLTTTHFPAVLYVLSKIISSAFSTNTPSVGFFRNDKSIMPSPAEATAECAVMVDTTPSWIQEALADANNDNRERPWKHSMKEAPVNEGMTDKPDVVTVKDDLSMMMSTLAA